MLTLILISCNEKKGYAEQILMYGPVEWDFDSDACVSANQMGKMLGIMSMPDKYNNAMEKLVYWNNYVYYIYQRENQHMCRYRRQYLFDNIN